MIDYKLPGKIITIVIRDDSPMTFCGDSPSYRTVRIELTDEQLHAIKLRFTHSHDVNRYYEQISRAIIEEPSP